MSWTKNRPPVDRTTRARTLAKHPTCQCLGCSACAGGCNRASTDDDHLIPWFEGGDDADSNHQGMCHDCHVVKTKAETARAQAQRPRARRKPESHPGLA